MTDYIALIHKEADSDFGVSFPDFPGCITAGSSLSEAKKMAAEALELHVEGLLEEGEAIPSPTSLDAVMASRENRDAAAVVIPLAARKEKAVRYNITMRPTVMARIDALATARNLTRSAFLAEIALQGEQSDAE